MKVNIGCGGWPLPGFVNVDNLSTTAADVLADASQFLPFVDSSIEEVYAGHFLEHLTLTDADWFLKECQRVLKPGGVLAVVVPDMRAVLERYVNGKEQLVEFIPSSVSGRVWVNTTDLDDVCAGFIYSTLQESQHRHCYDSVTLRRKLERSGFTVEKEINRWFDPHIPVGAWYQCGWYARKAWAT